MLSLAVKIIAKKKYTQKVKIFKARKCLSKDCAFLNYARIGMMRLKINSRLKAYGLFQVQVKTVV